MSNASLILTYVLILIQSHHVNVGKKRGFAYVDVFNEDDAKKVFYDFHGQDLMGRAVTVDDATRR